MQRVSAETMVPVLATSEPIYPICMLVIADVVKLFSKLLSVPDLEQF